MSNPTPGYENHRAAETDVLTHINVPADRDGNPSVNDLNLGYNPNPAPGGGVSHQNAAANYPHQPPKPNPIPHSNGYKASAPPAPTPIRHSAPPSPGVEAARRLAPTPSLEDLFESSNAQPNRAAGNRPVASDMPTRAMQNSPPQRKALQNMERPHNGAQRNPSQPRSTARPANGNGNGQPPRRKPAAKPPSTAKFILFNLLKALFVLACLGLIAASIFAVGIMRYVVENTEDDGDTLDLALISQNASATTFIYALNTENPNAEVENDWVQYQELTGDNKSIWIPGDKMPTYIKDAAIAAEDRDFENHSGFSVSRTAFAFLNEVFKFRASFGGSTLDQQLVKNLTGEKEVVGEDGEATAGYQRKMREIYRAWVVNKNFTKSIILESYLNTMPLTGTIVGVQAAAREYFYKDVNELTLAQCAMIVGITNSPGRFSPYTNPDNCKVRRDYVLHSMLITDKITQAQYDAAVAEPIELYKGPREGNTSGVNSYFSDALLEEVVAAIMVKYNIERPAAVYKYYNSGWSIYTTVDITVQTQMEYVYRGWGSQEDGFVFPEIEGLGEVKHKDGTLTEELQKTQSAMVVIDYQGNMKGVVGGIGEKEKSLVQNRATQSVRQVGSTMKPIAAYALGIDSELIEYSSILEDSGVMPNPKKPVPDPETGELLNNWPQNVFNSGGKGAPTLVADAVAVSLNTVAVRVGMRVGIEEMYDFLVSTLQITSLVGEGDVNDKGLSPLVLGSMTYGISPKELAAAYQMFGNGGVYNSVHTYLHIKDASGNIVMEPKRTQIQAISAQSAYVMNRLLRNVVGRSAGTATSVNGTANGMAMTYMDSVAKTGTTDDDKDRWIVGLTPYYVSAVWWGYDHNAELEWPTSPKKNATILTWFTVMEAAQAGLPDRGFDRPDGITEQAFCRESGELATSNCTDTQTGYYTEKRIPEPCYIHSQPA